MKVLLSMLIPGILLFSAACSENPVAPEHEEDLTVNLQFVGDHVETLHAVQFTASITDHDGGVFTDLEQVTLQFRREGTTPWNEAMMPRMGTAFQGTVTFFESGEYQIRVMGQHHGHDHMEILHEMAGHLEVERAHEDAGGYRIEFEAFPGHVHEGEVTALRFWVYEDTETRPAATGLTTEIHCEDPAGSSESHAAIEVEAGVYEADHTFTGDGEAHVALHIATGTGEIEADFHFHVDHGH